jgi:hemoglobin
MRPVGFHRRFWQNRAEDSLRREKQLLVNFLCACSGGPLYYVGRDMKTSHRGMGVSESDWQRFIGHLETTLDTFEVPAAFAPTFPSAGAQAEAT